MTEKSRGRGSLIMLAVATAGFMFGSCTLFAVIVWALAWVPVAFWALTPLLVLMAALEVAIYIMLARLLFSGDFAENADLAFYGRLLWSSTHMGLTIWQLTYTIIAGTVSGIAASRRRAALSKGAVAYRFTLKPLRDEVDRQFLGMCH